LLSHKLPQLLTSALLVALAVSTFTLPAAAKSKKRRTAVAQSKSKFDKQAQTSNGRSSRNQAARRGKRGRRGITGVELADNAARESAANHAVVPDHIEVLEYGSTNSAETSRWLNPSVPRNASTDPATETLAPARGKRISIDSERVIQIQRALATRGFYAGETNGVYDEATIEAMRRFQINNKIAVTGYPTAHSLKRLGLGNW